MKGKRFEKKVQSNVVTLKIMKAKLLMFSIQKMKVKKKEFFLHLRKIIGDYSSICRR